MPQNVHSTSLLNGREFAFLMMRRRWNPTLLKEKAKPLLKLLQLKINKKSQVNRMNLKFLMFHL